MSRLTILVAVSSLIALSVATGTVVRAQSEGQDRRVFLPRTIINRHLPPIVDAPVIPAADVDDEVGDNELVLGVVVGGEARAYPINMLTGPRREIVNDMLGGRAIAATW